MTTSIFLCLFLGGAPATVDLTGSYEHSYGDRAGALHINFVDENRAEGWMVQETREDKNSVTRWYSKVFFQVDSQGGITMIASYVYGEKEATNGSEEHWDMEGERDERGRILANGNLKILPDTWKKTGHKPVPAPKGKKLG